jgi:hypothetical protein
MRRVVQGLSRRSSVVRRGGEEEGMEMQEINRENDELGD